MVKTIANNDWSYLQGTVDNRITLTTCLENHPESRVMVQAVEVKLARLEKNFCRGPPGC